MMFALATTAEGLMDLKEYLIGRWKFIHDFEREELRRTPPEHRLRQFFSLLELARTMDWQTSTPEEIEEVRRRWRKIKGLT